MNMLKWIAPLLLIAGALTLYACSKQEEPSTPVEDTAATRDQIEDKAPDEDVVGTGEDTDEVLEVVEESSSDEEPADEAIVLAVADPPGAMREWNSRKARTMPEWCPHNRRSVARTK